MANVVTCDGASWFGSVRLREQPGVARASTIKAAAVVCRRFIGRSLASGNWGSLAL